MFEATISMQVVKEEDKPSTAGDENTLLQTVIPLAQAEVAWSTNHGPKARLMSHLHCRRPHTTVRPRKKASSQLIVIR
jgi:hypothetical protein